MSKPFKTGKGDPNKNPFDTSIAYKLAFDLPLCLSEPIEFADFEVTETEHHDFQKQFWQWNHAHRSLDWCFATRHFPSVNGQHDVVRVWKRANEKQD